MTQNLDCAPGCATVTLELCRALRAQLEPIKIILLSEHASYTLFQQDAFHAGADACLLPSISHTDFLAAFDAVINAERSRESVLEIQEPPRLTRREIEILRLVAQGKTDKETAQELHISVNTVRNHIQNILRKLEANDREAAVWRAHHRGWI